MKTARTDLQTKKRTQPRQHFEDADPLVRHPSDIFEILHQIKQPVNHLMQLSIAQCSIYSSELTFIKSLQKSNPLAQANLQHSALLRAQVHVALPDFHPIPLSLPWRTSRLSLRLVFPNFNARPCRRRGAVRLITVAELQKQSSHLPSAPRLKSNQSPANRLYNLAKITFP
jgi:hypothetical protein